MPTPAETPEALAREVAAAYYRLTDVPGDPPPFEQVAAAVVRTLGITEEMVRIVDTAYEGERRKAARALHALMLAAKGEA